MRHAFTPDSLLRAIAKTGYFEVKSYDPADLCDLLEYKLNIGRDRGIRLLQESGFVLFQYNPDPTVHPKDRNDQWRLTLTESGEKVVQEL
jgi:hypothetical protein